MPTLNWAPKVSESWRGWAYVRVHGAGEELREHWAGRVVEFVQRRPFNGFQLNIPSTWAVEAFPDIHTVKLGLPDRVREERRNEGR
jgi:hypothetical protein